MQPDTYQNASRSPSVRSATELHPVPWRLHTRLHTSQAHLTSRAFYCGPSALRFVLGDEAEVGVRCFEQLAVLGEFAQVSLPYCLDGRPVMLQVRADGHQRRQVRRVHVRVREFPAEGEDPARRCKPGVWLTVYS